MTAAWVDVQRTLDSVEGPARRLGNSLLDDAWLLPFSDERDLRREQATDAFLQRFQQVCDLMLRKVLPKLLIAYAGSVKPLPFRDALDLLEKSDGIDSADWWEELNELRNMLTHEYAMTADDRIAALQQAWTNATQLISKIGALRAAVIGRTGA